MSGMFLLDDIHLTVSKSASKDTEFRVSEVDEQHISRLCGVKFILSKHSIIKGDGC